MSTVTMKHNMKTVCFIFARGGSKGLPGKNIKLLDGKPLIAYSIDLAKQCSSIDEIIVSTDDDEIAAVAREYGAEVPFVRPSELSSDKSSEWLALRHAVDWYSKERGVFDFFLSLPTTSPFRSRIDVESCLELINSDPNADAVITVREAERSPYFNMVEFSDEGYVSLVIKPENEISRRQDAPKVFDITTVAYAVRPTFIQKASGLFDGRLRAVQVRAERALDIDTAYDFMLAEAITSFRKK